MNDARFIITKGKAIPHTKSIKLYLNNEWIKDLISPDLSSIKMTQDMHDLLKSCSQPVESFDAWEVLRLNPKYHVDYILYGNYGPLQLEKRKVERIFNIQDDGHFMFIRVHCTDLIHQDDFAIEEALSLDAFFSTAYKQVCLENVNMSTGESVIFLVLPRDYISKNYILS